LSKVGLNLIIADFWNESADKDLSGACLGFLGINLLVVDDVIASGNDFINGICLLVDDEGESTGTSSCRVCLDVDALNFAILTKVIAQFLCKKIKEN